ncbi:MAG: hypothetical protein WCK49_07390 [Myxococcaceae bacterium]
MKQTLMKKLVAAFIFSLCAGHSGPLLAAAANEDDTISAYEQFLEEKLPGKPVSSKSNFIFTQILQQIVVAIGDPFLSNVVSIQKKLSSNPELLAFNDDLGNMGDLLTTIEKRTYIVLQQAKTAMLDQMRVIDKQRFEFYTKVLRHMLEEKVSLPKSLDDYEDSIRSYI